MKILPVIQEKQAHYEVYESKGKVFSVTSVTQLGRLSPDDDDKGLEQACWQDLIKLIIIPRCSRRLSWPDRVLHVLRSFLLILAVAPQGGHLHLLSGQERTEPFAQKSEHLQKYQNNYLGVCVSVSSESPPPKRH